MTATIQDRLRQLREEAGYSQEKLAAELGITRMTLAGYELGKRPPDSEYIIKIVNFFNCMPDYIFGMSPFKNNKHYEEWVSSTDTLNMGLSFLPSEKRSELVTALNWILQDNFTVNQIDSDKDYLIDKYISLTLPFTHLFQEFSKVVKNAENFGIEQKNIFEFYQMMEKDKAALADAINTACDDLFRFLLRHAPKEALPKP